MYCPRCSQQQVSDEVIFCTRCGFQLSGVKALLATDGALPAHTTDSQASRWLPSRKGARLGVKLIFFSVILLPLFFALSFTFDTPIPFWFPAISFLTGLTCVLYAAIFGEDILPSEQKGPSAFPEMVMNIPMLNSPAIGELGALRANTAEMVQPPSITENTTNLLRKTED
jgi:hypothetical protein